MATTLNDTFTSTGAKFFAHQEAMKNLRNGKGQCIVTHLMPTDRCQHSCAFCSVATREGDTLSLADMLAYLDILRKHGLKAVIISGGGNPILYKCSRTGRNFNDLVDSIHDRGLQIGLITNGMPLKKYYGDTIRESWGTVRPETLDKLTWVRISMSGLDHDEDEVFVPDVDREKTTLGFSYVYHDIHYEPLDTHHGKVSTQADLLTLDRSKVRPSLLATDRIEKLTKQLHQYASVYKPAYVRLLPNCLEPSQIAERCEVLQEMADTINEDIRIVGSPVFVQQKPPKAPGKCYIGYLHPVLNSDGYVYPCDSCVLNEKAGHKFAVTWRVCHWTEVATMYEQPLRSLIADPKQQCPGCVFNTSNEILTGVVNGTIEPTPPRVEPMHVNFV